MEDTSYTQKVEMAAKYIRQIKSRNSRLEMLCKKLFLIFAKFSGSICSGVYYWRDSDTGVFPVNFEKS